MQPKNKKEDYDDDHDDDEDEEEERTNGIVIDSQLDRAFRFPANLINLFMVFLSGNETRHVSHQTAPSSSTFNPNPSGKNYYYHHQDQHTYFLTGKGKKNQQLIFLLYIREETEIRPTHTNTYLNTGERRGVKINGLK